MYIYTLVSTRLQDNHLRHPTGISVRKKTAPCVPTTAQGPRMDAGPRKYLAKVKMGYQWISHIIYI